MTQLHQQQDRYSFYAVLTASVEFSDEDWSLILKAAEHHYDGTIRSSVKVGGWLYGRNNHRLFSNGEDKECEMSQREFGYVLKSLEMDRSDQARSIAARLHEIVNTMQSKQNEINEKLKP